jgi:hypothetical protein
MSDELLPMAERLTRDIDARCEEAGDALMEGFDLAYRWMWTSIGWMRTDRRARRGRPAADGAPHGHRCALLRYAVPMFPPRAPSPIPRLGASARRVRLTALAILAASFVGSACGGDSSGGGTGTGGGSGVGGAGGNAGSGGDGGMGGAAGSVATGGGGQGGSSGNPCVPNGACQSFGTTCKGPGGVQCQCVSTCLGTPSFQCYP